MNLSVTTPSIISKKHNYGTVETTKYVDTYPRLHKDPLAAGFKFGYWGQADFSPENTQRPLRSCVGEVTPAQKGVSYVSPAPTDPYYATVERGRSPSPLRSGSPGPGQTHASACFAMLYTHCCFDAFICRRCDSCCEHSARKAWLASRPCCTRVHERERDVHTVNWPHTSTIKTLYTLSAMTWACM